MSPYVPRTKSERLKGVDNSGQDRYREVVLACGHPAEGSPTLTNPDRYWCRDCGSFQAVSKSAKKRAA